GSAHHPRRAPLSRWRSGAPRPLGRRHRGELEADAQRRGGHDRLPRPPGRTEDAARLARGPRAHRLGTEPESVAGPDRRAVVDRAPQGVGARVVLEEPGEAVCGAKDEPGATTG